MTSRTCKWLHEQAQELAWQLGEAQRQIGEARQERDQLKADIEQNLQTVKNAEASAYKPTHVNSSLYGRNVAAPVGEAHAI